MTTIPKHLTPLDPNDRVVAHCQSDVSHLVVYADPKDGGATFDGGSTGGRLYFVIYDLDGRRLLDKPVGSCEVAIQWQDAIDAEKRAALR